MIVGSRGLRESSTDGVTWEHRAVSEDESEELREVVWTGNEFIALGNRGGYSSPDGVKWERWAARAPSKFCYGGGVFVACSAGQLSYSKDGRTWPPAETESRLQILSIIHTPPKPNDE